MMTTLRFEGGKELQQALLRLPSRVSRSIVREVLIEAAEPMRAHAARLAPQEPGAPDLRANIVVSPVRVEGGVSVAIGPAKPFYYGFFQEYGTKHHGAQPFLRPAFDTQTPAVLTRVRTSLWRELAAKGISRFVSRPTVVQSPGRFV